MTRRRWSGWCLGGIFCVLVSGCAAPSDARYKPLAAEVTVSISDEGVSALTELPAPSTYLREPNFIVRGRDRSGVFAPNGLLESALDADQIAAKRMQGAALALAPRLVDALERERSVLNPVQVRATLDSRLRSEADIQMTPVVVLELIGEGKVAFWSRLYTNYVDQKGQSQRRTYTYNSRFALPWAGVPSGTWSANDHLLLRRQIDWSFRALTQVVLRDVRGDFYAASQAPQPNIVATTKGLVDVHTVALAEFDGLKVAYQMFGTRRGLEALLVSDSSPPDRVFGP